MSSPQLQRPQPWNLPAQDSALWQSLHKLLKTANNAMPASAKRLEIARIDMTILELLMERPYLPSELAKELNVTQAAVSIAINRLEQRGHVRRTKDRADGRKVLIEMAEQGRMDVAAELIGTFSEIHKVVGAIPVADRKVIAEFLVAINEILESHTSRPSA